VILHSSLGFTELQIKFLLRWRSNAIMTYLRNLAVLAEKQTQAFDAADAMPQKNLHFEFHSLYMNFAFFRLLCASNDMSAFLLLLALFAFCVRQHPIWPVQC
jgi:hypothetical protein